MAGGEHLLRRRLFTLVAAIALASAVASPPPASATDRRGPIPWSDVDGTYAWARAAIDFVAGTNVWMRDFAQNADGSYPFQPSTLETRKYLVRASVEAFASSVPVDPTISFTDLDPSDAFYPFANVAVQLGWVKRTPAGGFQPDKPITTNILHRVLVLALGLRPAADALDGLHTADGVTFQTPKNFGTLLLGMRLGLRYNNPDDSQDVTPTTQLNRAQVAYSLYRAATEPSWATSELLAQYQSIVLPALTPDQQAIVQWGIRFVGFPYVWGGEWGVRSVEPSSLGGQPVPGFDCSGLTWWLLRANDGASWNVSPPRPYGGWTLAQRSSADMATVGKLSYEELQPGDLMFYDGGGHGRVDHVDTYIGNGWALDSSSSIGGVSIMGVGDGWYFDHFVHGRRVLPETTGS